MVTHGLRKRGGGADAMRETDPAEEMRRADKVMRAVGMEDLEEAAVPQLMPLSIQVGLVQDPWSCPADMGGWVQ